MNNIRAIRERQGISAAELACHLGVTAARVNALERQDNISPPLLTKICKLLNVEPGDIFRKSWEEFITVEEIAACLHVGYTTALKIAKTLPHIRIGTSFNAPVRVRTRDFNRFIERRLRNG